MQKAIVEHTADDLKYRLGWQTPVTLLIILLVGFLVLLPILFLVEKTFNVGDPLAFPATAYGTENLLSLFTEDYDIILNTVYVAVMATVMAVLFGFTIAWILTRTNIAAREKLERLMEVPYYMTPLVGALAWAVLASPKNGFLNQIWHSVGGKGDLFDIYTLFGIAWVMALFEGTVAYVMISASMKSMDPALEESARVMGASKLRTTLTVTLPLVLPGVLGATLFVFAEMLGSFAAALVLGIPGRIYVVTTSIWSTVEAFPPNYGKAAAMGLSLFLVMVLMLTFYRWVVNRGSYATITGKAFRPRPMDMGRTAWALFSICLLYIVLAVILPVAALLLTFYRWVVNRGSYATITGKAFRPRPMDMGRTAWVLFSICLLYILLAVILPVAALLLTSFQTFATVILSQARFTLANYQEALALGPVRAALANSIILGTCVATVGAVVMALLVWIIYRSTMRGRGIIEYLVMLPSSVPRLVFGLGLLWAWINMPGGLYGTLWLLGIAYFTVLLPLGVRTIAGVVLQIDKSLEECARVCGASWATQMRTVTLPLLRPGIIAAWMLLFAASVREVGASLLLMGPHSKVIGPSIVATWASSGTQLTAAMALIQTFVVMLALIILFRVMRGASKELL